MEHSAGKLEIKGAVFDLYVDDKGNWISYYKGYSVQAPTKDKLKAELTKKVKDDAATVEVPFLARSTYSSKAIAKGTAKGIHSANGNVLVEWDGTGQKEQISYGYTFLSGDADAGQWTLLIRKRQEAQEALDSYEREHKIDLEKKVREAIEKATTE